MSCRYYRVGWANHGYWFLFFAIQGPLYLAELGLKQLLCQRDIELPPWAGILYVHAVLLVTAHLFFFPPLMPSGVGPRFFDSLRSALSWLPVGHFPASSIQ